MSRQIHQNNLVSAIGGKPSIRECIKVILHWLITDPRSPHGKVFKMGESYEQGRVEVIKKKVSRKIFKTSSSMSMQ